MKILVTGANGYIGLRLLLSLAASEHEVVAVVRNKDRIPLGIRELYGQRLTLIELDFMHNIQAQAPCPEDISAAYYLIHSMGGEKFAKREKQCAENFVQWLRPTNCGQVIYLSGLVPKGGELSSHLASREKVCQILTDGEIPLTTLKASIIVGSGSASFEIIRDLVEKLPVIVMPKTALTDCQPIAIRNVIEYLRGVLGKSDCIGKSYDIGGPRVMSYKRMLQDFAKARKLKRCVFTVPIFSSRMSSYFLSLLTSTNYQIARRLVGSLHMQTVCQESRIKDLIDITPITYEQAIERAFSKIAQNRVPSTWYGALSSGSLTLREIRNVQVPDHGTLCDKQAMELAVSKGEVVDALWSLGGRRGWPNMMWAWRLRGIMDKVVGGIGMRRGRRSAHELKAGDALDFWRVILADREQGRLILYAEMKLPGEAWLEFSIIDGILHQTATFRPLGVFGRAYWYSTYLLHLVLFPGMVKTLVNGWPEQSSVR